jgi:hypothetical protein
MKVTGRCHCGNISYEAEVDPAKVSICHCTDCQNLSGSPFRVSVPAPKETFRMLGARPKTYVKTAESGTKRVHAFCPECGSPVYSCAISDPPLYSLRVGCLDKRDQLPPARQIWCDSALPWSMNVEKVAQVRRQ